MSAEGPGEWLSVQRCALEREVNVSTVRGWIRRGLLRAYRVRGSRLIRVKRADLDALMEPLPTYEPARVSPRLKVLP